MRANAFIRTIRAQDTIGQRVGLSACDLAKINKRYNCPVMKDAPVCADETIGPVPTNCVDRHPLCELAKADPGYCDSFPGIYKRLCDQTCNGCDGSDLLTRFIYPAPLFLQVRNASTLLSTSCSADRSKKI